MGWYIRICKRFNKKKLLIVDPKKRLKPDEILKHPWIVGEVTPRSNLPRLEKKK